jgi:DNA-binding HxlR family transcriptional regulator
MLGGKWRLLIINEIGTNRKRYSELKKGIPEISEKMLTQELKTLIDNELIIRHNYGEVPPRVDYFLSEKGKKALELIEPIKNFGLQYVKMD